MAAEKWIYFFGEGDKSMKMSLGGKGANLSEMMNLGLPIPPGYTITSECCIAYQSNMRYPYGLEEQNLANLKQLERVFGKKFGASGDPLLLSVRSGAAVSMPGMMDTVLNLGLNSESVEALARKSGNRRWAYDSYRRFITMFGDVCKDIDREKFEKVLDKVKAQEGVRDDTELSAEGLVKVCKLSLKVYKATTGEDFPTDPLTQLNVAIKAVFDSWNNPRAIKYRDLNFIPHSMGTAVNVQAMVFGNMGDDCATGVGFTRNPSTGENRRYGEYLMNAQGEDVVAGIRTPKSFDDMSEDMPRIHKELYGIMDLLENHYHDMQDIEFTVQQNKLWMLQTRNGKRTAGAAVAMAVQMYDEGLIDAKTAVMRVTPEQIELILHAMFDPVAKKKATPIAKGLPASPGAAVGSVVFTSEDAAAAEEDGRKVILVRLETSPEDIQGMASAEGILTARGGMTSHAAVVARGMNKCCVSGCADISIGHGVVTSCTIAGRTVRKGDILSISGTDGTIYIGELPVIMPEVGGQVETLLKMADKFRRMGIRANADTPKDALVARDFGAEGIGLCRTEHMFFDPSRTLAVREMILAETRAARDIALAKLLPEQRSDFHGILGAMSGSPVIIRLIDPPLHEFLPHTDAEMAELARAIPGLTKAQIKAKCESMQEFNPMLGFRGCRLGAVNPEINEMQVRAIFEASLALVAEGKTPLPSIEIPLVGNFKEYKPLKDMVIRLAHETGAHGKVHYEVGTMIEVPRACLVANELAEEADFMSFGTNDLTQMTCGFSRDDSGVFLREYVKQGIYKRDPFQSIDQQGVGRMMMLCIALARSTKPAIDIGLCGEHGGDPTSVEFCHRIGLDNVSCSPYRVPVARLAAAHASLKYGNNVQGNLVTFLNAKL
jgi:pyruvate,orthophosphate dikinase